MYFSRKQYFRDTTAPTGLGEMINVRQALPVVPKQRIFPEPMFLDQKSDYFGNDLITFKDMNGMIKTISIMKGSNKPRGINANVKWSMTPNKFKRGRGLNSENSFKVPRGRGASGGGSTEFFKSRYQSAFDEMLIEKKIRDADKLSSKKVKVLDKELKKKNDKIDAQFKTQAETEKRVRQLEQNIQNETEERRRYERVLSEERTRVSRLEGKLEKERRRRPTGFSSDDVGDRPPPQAQAQKGKGGKGKAPPPPPPRKKTPEEIEAERKAIIGEGGGGLSDVLKAITPGITPGQIKKIKEDAKQEKQSKKLQLIAEGDEPVLTTTEPPAEEPSEEPSEEISKLESFEEQDEGALLSRQGSEPTPLTSRQKQQEEVARIVKDLEEEELPTPAPRKTKFSSFIEEATLPSPTARRPSKNFLKQLEKEAEEQRKKGAEALGESFTAVVEGQKTTTTPRPTIPSDEGDKPQPKIPKPETPPKIPPLSDVLQPTIPKPETPPKIPSLSEGKKDDDRATALQYFKDNPFAVKFEIGDKVFSVGAGAGLNLIEKKKKKAPDKPKHSPELEMAREYLLKNPFADNFTIGDRFFDFTKGGIIESSVKQQQGTSQAERQEIQVKKEVESQKAFEKKQTEEFEAKQKESLDRQLKVISDKYAGVNFNKGASKILDNMFKGIVSQGLSEDLVEPTMDRAVRDLNSYLQLKGKNKVGKKTIEKSKGKLLGFD